MLPFQILFRPPRSASYDTGGVKVHARHRLREVSWRVNVLRQSSRTPGNRNSSKQRCALARNLGHSTVTQGNENVLPNLLSQHAICLFSTWLSKEAVQTKFNLPNSRKRALRRVVIAHFCSPCNTEYNVLYNNEVRMTCHQVGSTTETRRKNLSQRKGSASRKQRLACC